ncbi:hypothetical protein C4K40_3361 [Pseudomonas sp. CMR5c]|nr:hypothetical protein C4K40_3361 [Pseudomonas sp. CMR5c]
MSLPCRRSVLAYCTPCRPVPVAGHERIALRSARAARVLKQNGWRSRCKECTSGSGPTFTLTLGRNEKFRLFSCRCDCLVTMREPV